jgi:hypothetical protein
MKTLKAFFLTIVSVLVLLSCKKENFKPKSSSKFMLTYEDYQSTNQKGEILMLNYYNMSGEVMTIESLVDRPNQTFFNVFDPILIDDIDLTKPIDIVAYSLKYVNDTTVAPEPGTYQLYFDGSLVDTKTTTSQDYTYTYNQ